MIKKLIYICIIPATIMANNNREITLEHNSSSKNPLEIILKVTNTADKSIEIDPGGFPNSDGYIVRDIFTVIEDGEEVPYQGPIIYMLKKPKKILKEGESYQGHVNIAKYYKLKTGTHNYEIHYGKNDNNLSIPLEIEATITSNPRISRAARAITCNNSQLNELGINLSHARSYALKAYNYLPTVDRNHALYRNWFGTATAGRYHIVYTNYGKIYNGLNQNIPFNCNPPEYCSNNTIAFVFSNKPYEINICNLYWTRSKLEKASTLIHEMSHFTNIAGTIDGDGTVDSEGYGVRTGSDWAKWIAQNNPTAAIHNAYSYHLYSQELATQGGGGSSSTNRWTTGTYANNQNISKTLRVSSARRVSVRIDGETEAGYDFINIYNSKGQFLRQFSGVTHTSFTVNGKSIIVQLVTDGSVVKSGVTISIKRKKYWWEF